MGDVAHAALHDRADLALPFPGLGGDAAHVGHVGHALDHQHVAGLREVVRFEFRHPVDLPARALERIDALEDVAHGQRRSGDGPAGDGRPQHRRADDARRDAELIHGVRDDAGRIAQRDEPLDHALRRARYRHQLDVLGRDAAGQSFRLCNRHWSASRSSGFAVSRHFNLLPRGAQSRAPRTERYTDCAAGGGPLRSDRLPRRAPLATVAAFPAQRFAFPRNSDRAH